MNYKPTLGSTFIRIGDSADSSELIVKYLSHGIKISCKDNPGPIFYHGSTGGNSPLTFEALSVIYVTLTTDENQCAFLPSENNNCNRLLIEYSHAVSVKTVDMWDKNGVDVFIKKGSKYNDLFFRLIVAIMADNKADPDYDGFK